MQCSFLLNINFDPPIKPFVTRLPKLFYIDQFIAFHYPHHTVHKHIPILPQNQTSEFTLLCFFSIFVDKKFGLPLYLSVYKGKNIR